MEIRSKKHPGVFMLKGKKKVSYGIDYIHPQTGKRVRKIVKAATDAADAADARSIEIADAKRGAYNKAYGIHDRGKPVLFDDMAQLYLKNWSTQNKDLRTDKGRISALTGFFKGKLMSDINPFMVEKFKITKSRKVSKATVNKYMSLGSQIFEKAKLWDKFSGSNPFLAVSRFKIKKGKKPGCLTPEQVGAIMAQIKHQVKRDMVEFAYNTGWRISEITGLKWDDVDLAKGTAWIVDPKNSNTVQIELNDRAIVIIRQQGRNGDHVFCHKNGRRFKTGLPGVFKEAANRAGVLLPPRRAWHILRRTWASMFLQNGGDVETLRQLGNWRDYSMPMWYADAANRNHRKKILNRIPKPDVVKMPENENVIGITH